MTGPILTKVNTFRSTEEERELWDRQVEAGGFKDFTAFVRTRLNMGEPAAAVKGTDEEAPSRAPAPPPPFQERRHHPRCTCRVCKPQQR